MKRQIKNCRESDSGIIDDSTTDIMASQIMAEDAPVKSSLLNIVNNDPAVAMGSSPRSVSSLSMSTSSSGGSDCSSLYDLTDYPEDEEEDTLLSDGLVAQLRARAVTTFKKGNLIFSGGRKSPLQTLNRNRDSGFRKDVELMKVTLLELEEKLEAQRKVAGRPSNIDSMTSDQVSFKSVFKEAINCRYLPSLCLNM